MLSNATNAMGPLPSLRSTLQKYGLQNLLNDTPHMVMFSQKPILFTPPSDQSHAARRQVHQGISAPQVYQSFAVAQAQRGIAAPKIYRAEAESSEQQGSVSKVKRKRAHIQR